MVAKRPVKSRNFLSMPALEGQRCGNQDNISIPPSFFAGTMIDARHYPGRQFLFGALGADAGQAEASSLYRYAVGGLALWVPADSPLDVEHKGMNVLSDRAIKKIAIANPQHAPYAGSSGGEETCAVVR